MNISKEELKTIQCLSYTYLDDIENVYKAFFSPRALTTVGLLGSLFDITEIKGAKLDTLNCEYKMIWKGECELNFYLKTIENIQDGCFRSISQQIITMDGKPVTSILIKRFNFYRVTCDNSTILQMEVLYEKEDDEFFDKYNKIVDLKKRMLFAQQLEKYLKNLNKIKLHIESIVINRPISQVMQYFSDGYKVVTQLYKKNGKVTYIKKNEFNRNCLITNSNDKSLKEKNVIEVEGNNNEFLIKYSGKKTCYDKDKFVISYDKEINEKKFNVNYWHSVSLNVYKLCSMSCYLSIETSIDVHVSGKYLNLLSKNNQKILKRMKEILEKLACYQD